VSPFAKGGKERYPSLEKRGKGRFEGTKSYLIPLCKSGGRKNKIGSGNIK
jgi:hypothetical protein